MRPKEKRSNDTQSEASLERKLLRVVKDAGGLTIKLPALWYVGIPDRLVLLPGARIFFIELKQRKKKATEHQAKWIRRLRSLGFNAGTVAGSEALDKFLETHVKTFDRMAA